MFAQAKKTLDKTLELLVTVSMGGLVVDVVWQVFTRYVLKNPSSWTEELATFLMIWVGLLGGSVALNRGAHLGIDYLVTKLSPRKALYVTLFVFAVIAVFSLLVMVVGGTQLVHRTLVTKQVSPALGLKMGYVYLAIPISGFFLVVYSIELFIETLTALIKHRQAEEPHIFKSGTLD
ncbi:MAG: TRAP transporter small permease [Sedimentisphaerales bacterium]|nr:TRAP transporter small permease [Sedimentisphaerales bacterium]